MHSAFKHQKDFSPFSTLCHTTISFCQKATNANLSGKVYDNTFRVANILITFINELHTT